MAFFWVYNLFSAILSSGLLLVIYKSPAPPISKIDFRVVSPRSPTMVGITVTFWFPYIFISFFQAAVVLILVYGCTTWTAGEEARRQLHKNAVSNIQQVLAAIPHKAPTIRPPASHQKNIHVWRTRHAGHCWRSRDELISDVLLWSPAYGRGKAGRPAQSYLHQLCEDTVCSPEDLPEAMNDKEK